MFNLNQLLKSLLLLLLLLINCFINCLNEHQNDNNQNISKKNNLLLPTINNPNIKTIKYYQQQHIPQLPKCLPGMIYSLKHYGCIPINNNNYYQQLIQPLSALLSKPLKIPAIADIGIEPIKQQSINFIENINNDDTNDDEDDSKTITLNEKLIGLAQLINLSLIKFNRVELKLDMTLSIINSFNRIIITLLSSLSLQCKINNNNKVSNNQNFINKNKIFSSLLPYLLNNNQYLSSNNLLNNPFINNPLQTMFDHSLFNNFKSDDFDNNNNNNLFSAKIDDNFDFNDQQQQQQGQEQMKKIIDKKVTIDSSDELRKEENEVRQRIMEIFLKLMSDQQQQLQQEWDAIQTKLQEQQLQQFEQLQQQQPLNKQEELQQDDNDKNTTKIVESTSTPITTTPSSPSTSKPVVKEKKTKKNIIINT